MINEQITEKNEIISNDEPKISKSNNRKYLIENIASKIFMISAFISVISLLLIIGFVFYKGLTPFLFKGYSFMDFIMGTDWLPNSDKFGVTSMIAVLATLGSLIIGVPIGIFTATFLAEIAPKSVQRIILPAVELLSGIPSVLYGLFGLAFIVPKIQSILNLPKGQSLLAVILVLAIMMLPTIISVSQTAIKAVPASYKEGSLALGASTTETIFRVTLPAAKSGILAAVVEL